MLAISLQSGSNGNCIYVEAGGVRLLFDAGLSGREARARLRQCGQEIDGVDALLVSHEHSDHVRSAGIFHRMLRAPIYMTEGTHRAAAGRLGALTDLRCFRAGEALQIGPVRVETLPTPHDVAEGVGFVVCAEGRRLGILTDLGHGFRALCDVLGTLDGVFIESNYDPQMLDWGPYPEHLKARIRGPHGHISNVASARLLRDHTDGRLQWACLAHLSETNNEPDLALATHRRVLGERLPLYVAGRYGASAALTLQPACAA